ncbi:hypothetical protein TSUD_274290 [Trifolium subterraneum]|uniref:Uncharacterized protein n=1 Tax=Trifolium subterraneum TaxID=3900 RepID=A0A2Z6MWY3_TRISU|nr:hypothetical protein TSUD_191550 [Trifolium subterraneum]GAU37068.1 hypothetical protein TSUD_274290 [Trifolium subterraneum]
MMQSDETDFGSSQLCSGDGDDTGSTHGRRQCLLLPLLFPYSASSFLCLFVLFLSLASFASLFSD